MKDKGQKKTTKRKKNMMGKDKLVPSEWIFSFIVLFGFILLSLFVDVMKRKRRPQYLQD